MQRSIVDTGSRKVTSVAVVLSDGGMVGRHIDGVGRNRHRRREVHLLPSRAGFFLERPLGKQRSVAAPQAPDMRTRVGACLVEPNTRDEPAPVRLELDAQFNGTGIGT